MSQMVTVYVQMMMIVRQPMVYAAGCGMTVGSCEIVKGSRTIGSCWAAGLHLVIFYCGSSIAILPRRHHVFRYVDASMDCRIILRKAYRGVVDGSVLLHLCKGKAWAVEQVEKRKWARFSLDDMNAMIIISEVIRRLNMQIR